MIDPTLILRLDQITKQLKRIADTLEGVQDETTQ